MGEELKLLSGSCNGSFTNASGQRLPEIYPFFTGLVLIALLLTPVLKTLHAGDLKTEILQDADWQEFQDKLQKTETQVRKQMTETADAAENGKTQDEQKKIEVKEIEVQP